MLSTTLPFRAHGRHDVGSEMANHPDEIAEDLLAPPPLERLVPAEGIAEIDRPGEVLFGSIQSVSGQELLGSQNSERVEQLRPDLVLATVTPSCRDQRCPVSLPFGEQRQQSVVLVIGMRGRHHEATDRVELAQSKAQLDSGLTRLDRLGEPLRWAQDTQPE